MNKPDLIVAVAEKTGRSKKDAAEFVDAIFDVVKESLAAGTEVSIHGFGKFEVCEVKARNGVNPSTGEEIRIPAGKRVKFQPRKTLKEEVNG